MITDLIRKIRVNGLRKSIHYGMFETKRLLLNRCLLKSYSLDREDLIIQRLCDREGPGFYVDVGACHPSRLNNTQRFYNQGWRGINIEANPSALELFERERPRDINVIRGIGLKPEVADFYVMYPPTVSTFSKGFMEMNRARGCDLVRTEKVEIQGLGVILQELMPAGAMIDFFSIDVEGRDFEVLQSNDWTKFRPKVVCIESATQYWGSSVQNSVFEQHRFLNERGYDLAYHNGMDCFYVRRTEL